MNMSWPNRSRLLRTPISEGQTSDPHTRQWSENDEYYVRLRTLIETAQDTFIGETTESITMARNRCSTDCHRTENVRRDLTYLGKSPDDWKFTIMRMVMYVHCYGFRPESKQDSKVHQVGWSIRPPEAALIHKVLTDHRTRNDARRHSNFITPHELFGTRRRVCICKAISKRHRSCCGPH